MQKGAISIAAVLGIVTGLLVVTGVGVGVYFDMQSDQKRKERIQAQSERAMLAADEEESEAVDTAASPTAVAQEQSPTPATSAPAATVSAGSSVQVSVPAPSAPRPVVTEAMATRQCPLWSYSSDGSSGNVNTGTEAQVAVGDSIRYEWKATGAVEAWGPAGAVKPEHSSWSTTFTAGKKTLEFIFKWSDGSYALCSETYTAIDTSGPPTASFDASTLTSDTTTFMLRGTAKNTLSVGVMAYQDGEEVHGCSAMVDGTTGKWACTLPLYAWLDGPVYPGDTFEAVLSTDDGTVLNRATLRLK